MVEFNKVSKPVLVKTKQVGKYVDGVVEQEFKVGEYSFTLRHKCYTQKDGSVSITDYDNTKNEALNSDIEKELCSLYNPSEAFELYELISIEAESEALKIF